MAIVQLNLFAFTLTLILLGSMIFKRDFSYRTHAYYFWMLGLTAAVLILDIISETSNGLTSPLMRLVHPLSTAMLFSVSGFIGLNWLLYVWHHVFPNQTLSSKVRWALLTPSIIIIAASFYSMFAPGIFFVTEDNVYQRGPLFLPQAMVLYLYMVVTLVVIVKQWRHLNRNERLALLTVPLFPVIGGTFQVFFYGLLLVWPMTTLSLLLVYLFIQSQLGGLDALTQVLNRREYEHHLESLRRRKKPLRMGALLFDIHDFKAVNDRQGHSAGDEVLKTLGQVLNHVFHPHKTLYRIGGDEFMVLLKNVQANDLENYATHVIENFKKTSHIKNVTLDYGYAVFDPLDPTNIEQFIDAADQQMYQLKKQHQSVS